MWIWGFTLPLLTAFAAFGLWYPFYFLASGATVYYSLFPIVEGKGRQHALGAEVLFLSLVASVVMQEVLNDTAPLIAHQAIDGIVGATFLWVTIRHRALWSALCVAVQAGMAVLTYYQYMYNVYTTEGYLTRLNLLFIAALVIVNTAVLIGRRPVGETVDGFFLRHFRGWTFTGLRLPRLYPDRAKA